MKVKWHILIVTVGLFLSGCAAMGLAELGVAEIGMAEIGAVRGLAAARALTLADGLTGARAIATAENLGTIMRSSVTAEGLGLLRRTIPATEYSIIADGVIADEVSANSLFGRVRVSRLTASSPRLYLRTGYKEVVEFAEVTSNKSIRLLRSGKEYSLPGRLYSVRPDVVKLREAAGTQYNVLARITKDQVVIVLDEMPVNNWYHVRVGDKVGYILGSLLLMVGSDRKENTSSISEVRYKNVSCTKCTGTGHTSCQTCLGNGNYICSSCQGKGKNTCSSCNAKGRLTCTTCNGAGGHSCETCSSKGSINCKKCYGTGVNVSILGKISTCSVCFGNGKSNCTTCYGSGKLNCNNCFGSGYLNCNTCYGSGELNCNTCYGRGKLNCTTCYGSGDASCSACRGSGIVQVRY